MSSGWAQVLVSGLAGTATCVTLVFLVISNRRQVKVNRMDVLQRVMSEMNQIRRFRGEHPEVEKILFPSRQEETVAQLKAHLVVVEMVNVFEWAYFAKRAALINEDEWSSWVATWRDVVSSEMRPFLANDSVWTFARDADVMREIKALLDFPATTPAPVTVASTGGGG